MYHTHTHIYIHIKENQPESTTSRSLVTASSAKVLYELHRWSTLALADGSAVEALQVQSKERGDFWQGYWVWGDGTWMVTDDWWLMVIIVIIIIDDDHYNCWW